MHSPGVPKEARLLNYYVTRLGGQILLSAKTFLGFSWVSVSAALRSALALTLDFLCVETILLNCEHEGVCFRLSLRREHNGGPRCLFRGGVEWNSINIRERKTDGCNDDVVQMVDANG